MSNRRRNPRVPVAFYADQLIDGEPHRCFATNLSLNGIFLERPLSTLERRSRTVQLEFCLPNDTVQSVWSRAEVVYDSFDDLFHGTALRFTSMANQDRSRLREWVTRQDRVVRSNCRLVQVPAALEGLRPPKWLS